MTTIFRTLRKSVLAALATATMLAVAPLAPAMAQSVQLTLDQEFLLQEISQYNTQQRSVAGRFVQIDGNGNRAEGTFFLQRPNNIRFRYGPPSREEIVSNGSGFYVINREERTQYAYAQDQVPLRQFLGDEVRLAQANLTNVIISETHAAVTLADDSPIGVVQVTLIFDIATKDLVQWSLIEPSGAETTVSLYDHERNVEIPSSYFRIDPTYRAIQQP